MGKSDSISIHPTDTAKGSDWGCDQEVTRIFVDNVSIVMHEMTY